MKVKDLLKLEWENFLEKEKVGEWKENLDPKLVKKIEDHFIKK